MENNRLRCMAIFSAVTFVLTLMVIYFIDSLSKNSISTFFRITNSNSRPAQLTCLLDAHRAFQSLNASWFITFGSALFYHRSKSFDTSDIDTGMFYDDLAPISNQLVSAFRAHGFRLLSNYGTLRNGQEWTFQCPSTDFRLDIFVFYPPLPTDPKSPSFLWWAASYNGLCDNMRYRKCRWQFSSITPEEVIIQNTSFLISPKSLLVEQYGNDWTVPKALTYTEILNVSPNLIKE